MVGNFEEVQTGFQFDNFSRNEKLVQSGIKMPNATKTGTTIAGVVFKDGVVLGADTRSTSGDLIANKNCDKLHYLQPNIYCAGAGTAADLDVSTLTMSSQLELHRLNTGRQVQVRTANKMMKQMLFRYQGHIGAHLIIGGMDKNGPSLYSVAAHGSSDCGAYQCMGSGSLAGMAVFEQHWKPKMELEAAKKLVRDAIAAGILNDPYSGSNVDLVVITRDGATHVRPYEVTCTKGIRKGTYSYPKGTTAVLKTTVKPIEIISEEVKPVQPEAMDVE